MELKISEIQAPEEILFNYEELKAELTAKARDYELTVYSEDKIKEAKADKAALNKLKKALNDERIRRERIYMKPFAEFKDRINELIGIIDKPIGIIDSQVKEFESKKTAEKQEAIEEIWMNMPNKPAFLTLGTIWNQKWTNATFSLVKIEEEIEARIITINNDIKTLQSLESCAFEAIEDYKVNLDLSHAIEEGKRLADIQKRKEEAAYMQDKDEKAEKNTEPAIESKAVEISQEQSENPEDNGQWITFKAYLTIENALKLKQFFDDNNINFTKA